MGSTAHLEVEVTSSGVRSADKDLKALTATAKETEKQQQHMAAVFAEVAAAEEKEAAKAVAASQAKAVAAERAAQQAATAAAREAEAWNDAKQKALARYDQQSAAAERAAERQTAATARAIARENEMWDRAIQRAKAGLDGVLPARPSLQRIEAKQDQSQSQTAAMLGGAGKGALDSVGMGVLAGGAAGIAAAGVTTLIGKLGELKNSVVANLVEYDNMIARLGGVTDSAEQASETFGDLQRLTFGKLPSTLHEVNDAFVQLGNNGLSNSNAALKSYSNIASQTGHSLGEVTHAVQAATLGNYKSLHEFGIKVKEEGGDLQVTFRGQTETIGNNAAAIEGYMQSLGNVQFAGAVERQMDTVGGAIKKQHDAWEKLINTIGDSALGSVVAASVGAGVSVLDAMTASVDALFGKIEKGKRELASEKQKQDEQSKLDKIMVSWADPSASKAEINAVGEDIAQGRNRDPDKLLAHYTRISAQLDKFEKLGETMVGDMTIAEARKEAESNYRRAQGENKAKPSGYTPNIGTPDDSGYAAYQAMRVKQDADELRSVQESLAKKEHAEKAFYEHNKEILQDAKGDQTAYLTANEKTWTEYIDSVAEKAAKKQIELQQKLRKIGVGPDTSQAQMVNSKYAGQQFELEGALAENMSGKNGEVLKIEAEQTYAAKSIAIERARAQEIRAINLELVHQSAQNAELIFAGLATAMKNGHGEMSAEYRTMFAIQKTFGIAAAEIAMYQAMAEAGKQPFPANIPLYLKAAAQGAQIIAQMSSLSYSGAYDAGGNIAGGSYGDVGERDWELVRGAKVAGPAQVIGREATAAMLGGGKTERTVVVIGAEQAFKGWLGSTAHQQAMVTFVKQNGALIRTVAR